MTYKEEVLRRHPDSIQVDCFGGILGCPGEYFLGAPESGNCGNRPIIEEENCEKCWNTEIPVATNADRIRAMTDEELAAWIVETTYICACCSVIEGCQDAPHVSVCKKNVAEWLQKPAEEEP